MTPDTPTTPPTDVEPELPEPFDYIYVWDGKYGTRKLSPAPHNGRNCDRGVPVYTADTLRTALAERDAARQQSERWQKSVDALRDERDALRQELEGLRAQEPVRREWRDEYGRWHEVFDEADMRNLPREGYEVRALYARPVQASAGPAETRLEHQARLMAEQDARAVTAQERRDRLGLPGTSPQPAPAREGRKPLTPEQQHTLWTKANSDWLTDEADFKAGIRFAEAAHGITPTEGDEA